METHVGLLFKKISEKMERRANDKSEKSGVTFAQGKVLWYLHRRGGDGVTMRDIERFFDVSHATVSGIVSRLEEKGYVSVETDKSDRRAKNVRVTDKEREMFREMKAHQRAMEESLLKGFSDDERRSLSEYLGRIYANLEEENFPAAPAGERNG